MKQLRLFLALLALPAIVAAQDAPKFGLSWSGFIKTDHFYDSRQVTSVRDGHFLLFPNGESLDKNKKDVNATPTFNIMSIQTRLTGKITGPDAFGAKTSGMIEAEFFGTSDNDINGFRLRHAYTKLNWPKTEILAGQFWHPFFPDRSFANVISFNTGAPFTPFARVPQLRVTRTLGMISLSGIASAERDFTSNGPAGLSNSYMRNSGMPEVTFLAQFKKPIKDAQLKILQEKYHAMAFEEPQIAAGFALEYKKLTPRLITDSGYKANESIESMAAMAYVRFSSPRFSCKLQGIYGQNMHDLMMLGGYAIRHTTDAEKIKKNYRDYTTLDVVSGWIDLQYNFPKFQVGLFGGYEQNLGSVKNISNWVSSKSFFARGYTIDHLYRVSPRFVFVQSKTRIALETEYTVAAYGSKINSLGELSEVKDIPNLRVLLAVIYNF